MRVIELSNHPADMLSAVSRRRQAAGRRGHDQYEDALIRHQASVQALRVKRDRARASRRWFTWLRLAFAVGAEKRGAPRSPLLPADDTGLEEKIRAGMAGEDLVAAELGHALDDDWTLLRGYRNRRGEIDELLLGPAGLFAIEVKYLNATVRVDGDRWHGDKYDNYGNLVEQRPIADRTGRSPSEQLNEPADELQQFLHERGQRVTIQRMVVLAHPRSRLDPGGRRTVHVATSPAGILRLAGGSADRIGHDQRADLERLIRRDHEFHQRTRPPARRR
jgi:Nuclease-related domain